jgi:hypothetical protein
MQVPNTTLGVSMVAARTVSPPDANL